MIRVVIADNHDRHVLFTHPTVVTLKEGGVLEVRDQDGNLLAWFKEWLYWEKM